MVKKRLLAGLLLAAVLSGCGSAEQGKTPAEYEAQQATREGREAAIGEEYPGAKIVAEKNVGDDLISVFEVGDQHSFNVYEPRETGYWLEFPGMPFSKTDLVMGTVPLGDDMYMYDIYLRGAEEYVYLDITRTDTETDKVIQQEQIYFDDSGIAIMKIEPEVHSWGTKIDGYDAEGQKTVLVDGEPYEKPLADPEDVAKKLAGRTLWRLILEGMQMLG